MRARLAVAVVLVLALAGCTGTDDGELTVFAAASLTEALTDLGGARFVFAGSTALARQIRDGAPADVFATADVATMRSLEEDRLVEEPVVFATNRMAIAVEPGNPRGITGVADLARDDLVVVLVDRSVPAGAYSETVLARAGVSVRPRSRELDVKAAVAKVRAGEADAAIVYASDVGGDERVDIPDAQNVTATYPIAVVAGSDHRDAAQAFVERVRSRRGQAVLARHGFLPAP